MSDSRYKELVDLTQLTRKRNDSDDETRRSVESDADTNQEREHIRKRPRRSDFDQMESSRSSQTTAQGEHRMFKREARDSVTDWKQSHSEKDQLQARLQTLHLNIKKFEASYGKLVQDLHTTQERIDGNNECVQHSIKEKEEAARSIETAVESIKIAERQKAVGEKILAESSNAITHYQYENDRLEAEGKGAYQMLSSIHAEKKELQSQDLEIQARLAKLGLSAGQATEDLPGIEGLTFLRSHFPGAKSTFALPSEHSAKPAPTPSTLAPFSLPLDPAPSSHDSFMRQASALSKLDAETTIKSQNTATGHDDWRHCSKSRATGQHSTGLGSPVPTALTNSSKDFQATPSEASLEEQRSGSTQGRTAGLPPLRTFDELAPWEQTIVYSGRTESSRFQALGEKFSCTRWIQDRARVGWRSRRRYVIVPHLTKFQMDILKNRLSAEKLRREIVALKDPQGRKEIWVYYDTDPAKPR